MSDAVLDSSAVLALLANENGAKVVEAVLPGALFSAVNMAETISKLVERGMPASEAQIVIQSLGVDIVDFDGQQALIAGDLRRTTRAAGLSLGDRACLALAQTRNLAALTADSAWRQVLNADIRFIREPS